MATIVKSYDISELMKKTATNEDIQKFVADAVATKLFTVADTVTATTDFQHTDIKLLDSNVSDFITVWSRYPRYDKKGDIKNGGDFGVRIKCELAERIPTIGIMFGNAKKLGDELRLSTTSLDYVTEVITNIYRYTQAYRLAQQTKNVTDSQSQTA